jgi:putative membrane-bound dehydrogenase-like protein
MFSAMSARASKTHLYPTSQRGKCLRKPCRQANFTLGVLVSLFVAASAAAGDDERTESVRGAHAASGALKDLVVHDDLEVTLFASEPMIVNPTNIDVDCRGRVWLCEVVNYHQNSRPEGDRIVVIEDSDRDGVAERSTVFYQSAEINGALGLCVFSSRVLGSRAFVACAGKVFLLSDDDGDDRADRKEVLFTGLGPQHDHSAHAAVFGPDGKLYWNFGNVGGRVLDRFGHQMVDPVGRPVVDRGKPYWGGMVFRSNLDGSAFEVLAHNFRNNYEVTVDSFGTLWQSDNDDDGNRSVRINYVMEFGNFGFRDEITGASWPSERTGMHQEIAKRHWHQNDAGVIPNLLTVGRGAPAGICIYEGDLLPQVFRGQIVHCDPLVGVVRSFPVEPEGAGYNARVVSILQGKNDAWFRPVDVCVAPDGSLFVADWYDPAVGGHNMADTGHGRIFRVAPPGTPYRVPAFDFDSVGGAIEALKNPNRAVSYRARTALAEREGEATEALVELYGSANPRHRARALWLLSQVEGHGGDHVRTALADADPDIRVTGLRAARQMGMEMHEIVKERVHDPSAAVRRECAIALRHERSPEAAWLWASLAEQHDVNDRWYLEALGIGADGQWDRFFDAWLRRVGSGWDGPAGRDIVWRSRAQKTPEYLARIIADPEVTAKELPPYLRAFDFQSGDRKTSVLSRLAFGDLMGSNARLEFIQEESLARLEGTDAVEDPRFEPALETVLGRSAGSERYIDLVASFGYAKRFPEVLEMAIASPDSPLGVKAARSLLEQGQVQLFHVAVASGELPRAVQTVRVLGNAADIRTFDLLLDTVEQEARPLELRRQATRALARTAKGAARLVERIEKGELDERLHMAAAFQLRRAPWRAVKAKADILFPSPVSSNEAPLPSIGELLRLPGNAANGRKVYERQDSCIRCHPVRGTGQAVGPDLSEIGAKLDAASLYESILYPSAGISHGYEAWVVTVKNGDVLTGRIIEDTSEVVSIQAADAIVRTVKKADVVERVQEFVSIMPADLQKQMTTAELVDLVAYLRTLRKGE